MVPLECRVRARPLFVTCDLPSSAAGGRDVDVEAVAGGLAVGHDLDLTGYEAYRVIEPIRVVSADHHRLFELPAESIVYCPDAPADSNGMVIVTCNEEDVSMLLRDLQDRAVLVASE